MRHWRALPGRRDKVVVSFSSLWRSGGWQRAFRNELKLGSTFPRALGQAGYGAFSVSESNVPKVANCIRDQEEHHRVKTFQEEYLEFLAKHKIQFDERYVWD
jgi:hypothetical protein